MILMVTGSRDWPSGDSLDIERVLNRLYVENRLNDGGYFIVKHGAARGVDQVAHEWCRTRINQGWMVHEIPFPVSRAQWRANPRMAGLARNAEMVTSGIEACVAFSYFRTSGTEDAIRCARASGIEPEIYRWEEIHGDSDGSGQGNLLDALPRD